MRANRIIIIFVAHNSEFGISNAEMFGEKKLLLPISAFDKLKSDLYWLYIVDSIIILNVSSLFKFNSNGRMTVCRFPFVCFHRLLQQCLEIFHFVYLFRFIRNLKYDIIWLGITTVYNGPPLADSGWVNRTTEMFLKPINNMKERRRRRRKKKDSTGMALKCVQ